MWHPSFSSIALVMVSLHLALADQIEARDGKQFNKNAIRKPLGPKVDTYWPVLIKWDPDTNGTISLKLFKGKGPDGMEECETIADHIKNTGIHIWLTGDWLEDSSTMKAGYKYELRIIDDESENYNLSPDFDLIVPYSTFTQQSTRENDDKSPKKGSNSVDEDLDFVEPEEVGTGKNHYQQHGNPKPQSETKGTTYITDTDDKGNEDENPTLGVGKNHKYHGKPKPYDKETQTQSSQKEPTDDELDFVEPEETVKIGKNHGKPKSSANTDSAEDDFVEPDSTITGSTKPPANGNVQPFSNVGTQTNITQQSTGPSSSSAGLPKAAAIGIAVAVIVVVVAIVLGIGWWRLNTHKKVMVEKKRSRIGYDGVGDFIAKGRSSVLYDGPQMAQYTPRQSIETRYDPPTGQGLPVVGSTPRHSVDTRYDPPSRQSVDTRYDPPSQAPLAHH
ncbi:hypothetical protein BGX38DRAFT_1273671 [Terfezia claveryi]|nr:hypothetical protein BGX38DRAFT_1273671 [Terfezia claveryi]